MRVTKGLPTALAISLGALATAAHSATPSGASSGATPQATARPHPSLDLKPPNFASPQWQERLQGPEVDHSLDYLPSMEYVVVTPAYEGPNTNVAPAGLGSVAWALLHPTEAWRILMPVEPGDEFNTDRQLALAYQDSQSDCPGFRGTPNVRPVCH